MKIHKKIFLIILLSILLTFINFNYNFANINDVQAILGMGNAAIGTTIQLSLKDMTDPSNKYLYCIQYHNRNSIADTQYKILTYIEIEDGCATAYDETGVHKSDYFEENDCLAQILSGKYGDTGYGTATGAYSATQQALYAYWNSWRAKVGEKIGINHTWDQKDAYDNSTGSRIINEARADIANGAKPSARIYLLNNNESKENWQRLMIAQASTTEEEVDNTQNLDYDGYIKIRGKVWLDEAKGKGNGIYGDSGESGLGGIEVMLCSSGGGQFPGSTIATTNPDGTYEIIVNRDYRGDGSKVYKLYRENNLVDEELKNGAYVQFKYDGLLYTTVKYDATGEKTSKAAENPDARYYFDEGNSVVTHNTGTPSGNTMTASTKVIGNFSNYKWQKIEPESPTIVWCNADGSKTSMSSEDDTDKCSWIKTNPTGAWKDPITLTGQTIGRDTHTQISWTDDLTKPIRDEDGNLTGTYEQKFDYGYFCKHWAPGGHSIETMSITNLVIYNVNLGLFEREQPDAALSSDIDRVEIVMNNQYYRYTYNEPQRAGDNEDNLFGTAKFQTKYKYVYRKEINPADIADANDACEKNNADERLNVYVTYKITVKNQSNTLKMVINRIQTTYDIAYTIVGDNNTGFSKSNHDWENAREVSDRNGTKLYKKAESKDLNIVLEPGEDKTIEITYRISNDVVRNQLLKKDATLSNAFEIYQYTTQYGKDTLYAEQRTGGRTGKPYAGRDLDSHPGNADVFVTTTELKVDTNDIRTESVLDIKNAEDDTDIAPSFILMPKKYYKTISGNVYEDTKTNKNDEGRLGNGIKDDGEFGVANVKVELINVGTNDVAQLYHVTRIDDRVPDTADEIENKYSIISAVTYTDENGNYSFGNNDTANGKWFGLAVDKYYIRFTYGNNKQEYVTTDENGNRITVGGIEADEVSTIEGNEINARNYKSTIVNEGPIKNIMNGVGDIEYVNKWHLLLEEVEREEKAEYITTIAVDDIEKRYYTTDSTSLIYENFEQEFNMEAISKPFELQVEYTIDPFAYVENSGTTSELDNKKNCNVFDFGIIERAREDLVIDKSISRLKLTLANGQILIDGVPGSEKLDYTKAVGINIDDTAKGRNQRQKLVTIEMDTEYIQSATLEIWYKITVSNNSEKDYEYKYGNEYKTNYYYFGEDFKGKKLVQKSIEKVVDYLDPELICIIPSEGDESESPNQTNKEYKWKTISANELKENGYISQKTKETLESEKYLAVYTDIFGEQDIPTGTSYTAELYVSKLLSNKDDELVFENHTEIAQINGTTARTIDKIETTKTKVNGENVETRTQYKKTYKSGDYIPSAAWSNTYYTSLDFEIPEKESEMVGQHEQDDDMVKIVITPPTGLDSNIIICIIISTIILTSLGIGIYLKKIKLKK